MNTNICDPRELLADKLNKAGIDDQNAFYIALDAGSNLVNRAYLKDLGLKGVNLKRAERIVMEFYWEESE